MRARKWDPPPKDTQLEEAKRLLKGLKDRKFATMLEELITRAGNAPPFGASDGTINKDTLNLLRGITKNQAEVERLVGVLVRNWDWQHVKDAEAREGKRP